MKGFSYTRAFTVHEIKSDKGYFTLTQFIIQVRFVSELSMLIEKIEENTESWVSMRMLDQNVSHVGKVS